MTHEEIKKLLEAINVAWGGDEAEVTITKEIELPEGATMYLFDCWDCKTSAICHKDGTVFVMRDWQEPTRPKSFEEIKDYKWCRADGRDAIIVDGLPRLLR